jgi:hypothetical protein
MMPSIRSRWIVAAVFVWLLAGSSTSARGQVELPGLSGAIARPDTERAEIVAFADALREASDLPRERRHEIADALAGAWLEEYVAATRWTTPPLTGTTTAELGASLAAAIARFAEQRTAAEQLLDARISEAVSGALADRWREMRQHARRTRWLAALAGVPGGHRCLEELPRLFEAVIAEPAPSPAWSAARAALVDSLDRSLIELSRAWPRATAQSTDAAARLATVGEHRWTELREAEAIAMTRPLRVGWTSLRAFHAGLRDGDRELADRLMRTHLCGVVDASAVASVLFPIEATRNAADDRLIEELEAMRARYESDREALVAEFLAQRIASLDRAVGRSIREAPSSRAEEAMVRACEGLRALERTTVFRIATLVADRGIEPSVATRSARAWAADGP